MRPMMSPWSWYGLLILRFGLAVGVGTLALVGIHSLPWPLWLRISIDVLVVNGLFVGSLATGALSYRRYLQEHERLRKAVAQLDGNRHGLGKVDLPERQE